MSQQDLDRLVARATGESVDVIRRLGFGLAAPPALRRRPRRRRRSRRRKAA